MFHFFEIQRKKTFLCFLKMYRNVQKVFITNFYFQQKQNFM